MISTVSSFSQTLSTQQLLIAWKASDKSQTTAAELTYTDLRDNANIAAYRERITALNNYLQKHPGDRLQIRTWMYEVLGKFELHLPRLENDKEHLKSAMKMADIMGDDQLLSELYSLYPRLENRDESNSYYVLRSIEMQQKIGVEHFPMLYLRMNSFSMRMYQVGAYNQSLRYGYQALALIGNRHSRDIDRVRVLQWDYLGSCYKQLKMPDSVLYCYHAIQTNIAVLENDTVYQKIWQGIAGGGIGYGLLLQKKYSEAIPYLQKNIASSVRYNLYADAALSMDALARINFAQRNYDSALHQWRVAYQWYGDDTLGRMHVSQNLSGLFNNKGMYDSAYFYNRQYYLFRTALDRRNSNGRLSALETRIEFDDMENSLQKAKSDIAREKSIRFYLLSGVFLLTVIVILLYNRYRLKQKHLAEQARRQVQVFTDKIRERETLIDQLRASLEANTGTEAALEERLLEYSLLTNEEWDKFRMEFLKAYPGFYPSLQKITGQLTPSEERLAALIHLQLSNRQIADTLGIAKDSVARSKRRLKQRLRLEDEDHLESFLTSLH